MKLLRFKIGEWTCVFFVHGIKKWWTITTEENGVHLVDFINEKHPTENIMCRGFYFFPFVIRCAKRLDEWSEIHERTFKKND